MNLALNNLQWLMCHKTKTKPNSKTGASPSNTVSYRTLDIPKFKWLLW